MRKTARQKKPTWGFLRRYWLPLAIFAGIGAALWLLVADVAYATKYGPVSCKVAWTEVHETISEKGVDTRWISNISLRCGEIIVQSSKGRAFGFSSEDWHKLVVGMPFTCIHKRTRGLIGFQYDILNDCR